MAKSTLKVRMDSELLRELEDFCADVGMSVSTLITVFARRVVKDQKLPFEIKGDIPNEETSAAQEEDKRKKADLNFDKIEKMMNDLDLSKFEKKLNDLNLDKVEKKMAKILKGL